MHVVFSEFFFLLSFSHNKSCDMQSMWLKASSLNHMICNVKKSTTKKKKQRNPTFTSFFKSKEKTITQCEENTPQRKKVKSVVNVIFPYFLPANI